MRLEGLGLGAGVNTNDYTFEMAAAAVRFGTGLTREDDLGQLFLHALVAW